jgi:hypothetical protein
MFRDALGEAAERIGIAPPKLLDIAQIAAASLPALQTAETPQPGG